MKSFFCTDVIFKNTLSILLLLLLSIMHYLGYATEKRPICLTESPRLSSLLKKENIHRQPQQSIHHAHYADIINKWTDGIVYYKFGFSVSDEQRENALKAMRHWESKTALRFIQRTNQANYIHIKYYYYLEYSCFANVGMYGGEQFMGTGGDCSFSTFLHEIGHAIGLWHEQQRSDNKQYLWIDRKDPDLIVYENFVDNYHGSRDYDDYDYYSIMHYAVPENMVLDDSVGPEHIGVLPDLSLGDIAIAEHLYGKPKMKRDRTCQRLPAAFYYNIGNGGFLSKNYCLPNEDFPDGINPDNYTVHEFSVMFGEDRKFAIEPVDIEELDYVIVNKQTGDEIVRGKSSILQHATQLGSFPIGDYLLFVSADKDSYGFYQFKFYPYIEDPCGKKFPELLIENSTNISVSGEFDQSDCRWEQVMSHHNGQSYADKILLNVKRQVKITIKPKAGAYAPQLYLKDKKLQSHKGANYCYENDYEITESILFPGEYQLIVGNCEYSATNTPYELEFEIEVVKNDVNQYTDYKRLNSAEELSLNIVNTSEEILQIKAIAMEPDQNGYPDDVADEKIELFSLNPFERKSLSHQELAVLFPNKTDEYMLFMEANGSFRSFVQSENSLASSCHSRNFAYPLYFDDDTSDAENRVIISNPTLTNRLNIRGSLLSSSGHIIGKPDQQLIDVLRANESVSLTMSDIAALFDVQWDSAAMLRLASIRTGLTINLQSNQFNGLSDISCERSSIDNMIPLLLANEGTGFGNRITVVNGEKDDVSLSVELYDENTFGKTFEIGSLPARSQLTFDNQHIHDLLGDVLNKNTPTTNLIFKASGQVKMKHYLHSNMDGNYIDMSCSSKEWLLDVSKSSSFIFMSNISSEEQIVRFSAYGMDGEKLNNEPIVLLELKPGEQTWLHGSEFYRKLSFAESSPISIKLDNLYIDVKDLHLKHGKLFNHSCY